MEVYSEVNNTNFLVIVSCDSYSFDLQKYAGVPQLLWYVQSLLWTLLETPVPTGQKPMNWGFIMLLFPVASYLQRQQEASQ